MARVVSVETRTRVRHDEKCDTLDACRNRSRKRRAKERKRQKLVARVEAGVIISQCRE